MQSLYENLTRLAKKAGYATLSQLCDEANVSRQTMTELKKGRTQKLSVKTAEKLCNTLGVTMDELYGISREETERPEVRDEDIIFALFGGDSEEITDEMFEEVKRFAQYVKAREKEKQGGTTR